jgi:L-ascorbate metabolism protein UlaG (beta-lactamase superfamily)
MIITILVVLLSAVALFYIAVFIFGNLLLSTPAYKGPVTDHFNGKHFFHPWQKRGGTAGFSDVLKWQMDRKRVRGEWKPQDNKPGEKPLPRVEGSELRVTFINHSTALIQTEGLNIITDPIYSKRAGPFFWTGPKRFKNPGIRFEDLPKIDIILLSHNHYDHLDHKTLTKLSARDNPLIVTALGVPHFLAQHKITNAIELDWWQTHKINDSVTIHSVPAQHFSGRGTVDRNTSLWCGFVISTSVGNVYFAADTGYVPVFKEIGERFGEMRVALIPIGAYIPRWFMQSVHVSPKEAVMMHKDVNSKLSIGIHHGTFRLADEGMDDPALDLAHELREQDVINDSFIVIGEGEVKSIPS